MGWESRGCSQHKYYTRSRKHNGRVIREYVGTGPSALIEANLDDLRRQEIVELRKLRLQELTRLTKADRIIRSLLVEMLQLELQVLRTLGFHSHRGQLRFSQTMETNVVSVWDKLRKANCGDPDSIEEAKAELVGPNRKMILEQAGDLARQSERLAFSNLGPDQKGAELAIREKMSALKLELAPSNPIEELMVDRIVQCWLQLHMAEILAMMQTPPIKAYESRVDSLNRRYLQALKTLTIVRSRSTRIFNSISIKISAGVGN